VRRATAHRQGSPKKDLVAALETEVRREVAAEAAHPIGDGGLDDFQAIETEARRMASQLMGQALARKLNADHCNEHVPQDAEYFSTNRERMDYPTFRATGLCVVTGVVEGGCKHIIGTRLKRGGMHWIVAGVDAIIALRCAIESNRFDDFWERRAIAMP